MSSRTDTCHISGSGCEITTFLTALNFHTFLSQRTVSVTSLGGHALAVTSYKQTCCYPLWGTLNDLKPQIIMESGFSMHACQTFLFFALTLLFSYSLLGNPTEDSNIDSIHFVGSCLKYYSYICTPKRLTCNSVSKLQHTAPTESYTQRHLRVPKFGSFGCPQLHSLIIGLLPLTTF